MGGEAANYKYEYRIVVLIIQTTKANPESESQKSTAYKRHRSRNFQSYWSPYVHMYVYIHTYTSIHTHTCVYVCIYRYVCVYIYISHIHHIVLVLHALVLIVKPACQPYTVGPQTVHLPAAASPRAAPWWSARTPCAPGHPGLP